MNFITIYVSAGVVTLAATLFQTHLEKKKRGPSFHDALYELTRQKASLWKRFTHELLVPALAGLLVICIWPVAIFWLVKHSLQQRQEAIQEAERKFRVTEEDLIEKLSIEEIERRERIDDPLGGVPDKPFGHLWLAWKSFAENLDSEDTIWSFAATDKSSYEPVRLGGYIAFDRSGAESIFITSRIPMSMD